MLIYMDVCSLQRPMDDRTQLRVALEADAVVTILAMCRSGLVELISSDALLQEIKRNPHPDRKAFALRTLEMATRFVSTSRELLNQYSPLAIGGLKPFDALHAASALVAKADYFCTCDDKLLRRFKSLGFRSPKIVGPLELVAEITL